MFLCMECVATLCTSTRSSNSGHNVPMGALAMLHMNASSEFNPEGIVHILSLCDVVAARGLHHAIVMVRLPWLLCLEGADDQHYWENGVGHRFGWTPHVFLRAKPNIRRSPSGGEKSVVMMPHV